MTIATQIKWKGRWQEMKGRAKRAWASLTDDDLNVAEGNYDELVGRIKARTGATAEEIGEQFDEWLHDDDMR